MTTPYSPTRPVKGLRIVARVLSVFIISFWGFLFFSEFAGRIGLTSSPSGGFTPLSTIDAMQFYSIPLILIGFCLSWKWELAGSLVTLPLAIFIIILNQGALIPMSVIATTSILFLICWWWNRSIQVMQNSVPLTDLTSPPSKDA